MIRSGPVRFGKYRSGRFLIADTTKEKKRRGQILLNVHMPFFGIIEIDLYSPIPKFYALLSTRVADIIIYSRNT